MFRAMQNPLQNMQQTQQLQQQTNTGATIHNAFMKQGQQAQVPPLNAMPQFDPNNANMGQVQRFGQQSGFGANAVPFAVDPNDPRIKNQSAEWIDYVNRGRAAGAFSPTGYPQPGQMPNGQMGPSNDQLMRIQQILAPNAQSPQSSFMQPSQQGQQGPVQQSGFGYQVNPGTGGYFEQQTPVGSFAGASQQQASAVGMSNPYIGQTSGQAAGAAPVQAATAATSNPYLGQQTQQVSYQGAQSAGQNAFAGSNPYLTQAIDAGAQDVIRNYQMAIAPQRDRAEAMSGSFAWRISATWGRRWRIRPTACGCRTTRSSRGLRSLH
jgi:hypothetical protein